MERYGHAHLDELESLPAAGLAWRPVRAHFDIRAFGCNAYTGAKGADVVEPHTESTDDGYSHEELYFVHSGRARFTLDGDTFDARAGTYVFVRDPSVHRYAVAEEDDTTVLSFGGPARFEPSAWEWYFRSEALRAEGDRVRARETIDAGFAVHPESPGLFYELACWEATGGDVEAARAALERAIALDPRLEQHSRTDADLAALRG